MFAAVVMAALVPAGCGGKTEVVYVHDDLAGWMPPSSSDLSAGPGPVDLGPCGPCSAPTPICDVKSRACVACLDDTHCPDAQICRGSACVPGCSAKHAACGDAGACDVDMGLCHGCLSDADCKDPKARFCDLPSGRCGGCNPVPGNDRCPEGSWCKAAGGTAQCVPGCRTDGECRVGDGGGATVLCCDHACVDTVSSAANCGGCGVSCGNAPDAMCCASSCVMTRSDIKACGGCGMVCRPANAVAECKGGACGFSACNPGYGDCDLAPHNGCEVATDSDARNCGACGKVCALQNALPLCIAGACKIGGCNPGFRDCDGDATNGCEVDVQRDQKNCGACGASCAQLPNAMATCQNAACAIGSCTPGFGNCNKMDADGCEARLDSDGLNCGGCGLVCPTPPNIIPTCAMGQCGSAGCVPGFADCNKLPGDGCEVNVKTNVNNCGTCGIACGNAPANAVAACAGGVCGFTCAQGFADCDANAGNGCEVNLQTDLNNCGKCATKCAVNDLCKAGACVPSFNCNGWTPLVIGGVTFCYSNQPGTCQQAHQFCEALGNGYRLFCGDDWQPGRSNEGCGNAGAYTSYDIVNQYFKGSTAIGGYSANSYNCVYGGANNQCVGDSGGNPADNMNGRYAFCAPKNYYKNPPDGPAFAQVCGN